MKMTSRMVPVKFLGFLQRLTGAREERLEMDEGATVADLLEALAARHGPEFGQAIFRAPGEVHTYLRVFLDEEEAAPSDRLMAEGAEPAAVRVLIVPGFEGGSR